MKNKLIIFISLFSSVILLLYIWLGDAISVSVLTEEDGLIEQLSAFFYIICILICLRSIIKTNRSILILIWLFLSILFLGEETSWFQRIANYSVTVIEEMNTQNEFNLHNLRIFQSGKLTADKLNLSDLFKSQNLFRMGFFGYFLLFPLFVRNSKIKDFLLKIGYKVPDKLFTISVLIVFVLSFSLALFSITEVKSSLAETREMLYAFFIMIYLYLYSLPQSSSKAASCVDLYSFGKKNRLQ